MAFKGKQELLAELVLSSENMQKVRRRKETERATASQQEAEPRAPSPVDLTKR